MTTPLILLLIAGGTMAAASPKIVSVSVPAGERRSVYVTFDPSPPEGQIRPIARWVIYSTAPAGSRRLRVRFVDTGTLASQATIRLEVSPTVPLDVTALDVSFYDDEGAVHVPKEAISLGTSQPGPPIAGAKGKDDSDIYVKGSYTAVVDGDPVYDIDAFAGYMKAVQLGASKTYIGRFGAYGQVRTKHSSKADPDSFLTYLVYQRHIGGGTGWAGPFSLPYISYRFAGWEFDREGKQLNFITSPVITLPMRLSGRLTGAAEPGLTFPNMTLQLGTEFVNVRSSPIAPAKEWHTRGLLGATFSTGYAPERQGFHSVQFTSAYQVRLPSSSEIFYDDKFAPIDPATGKKGDAPPLLGSQARHSLDTKITYNVVKWAGVTFEHTYGSLPPLFKKTGNTFEFGLVLTLKQTSYGRYSILKP
jgi:hypothetical protein